MRLGHCLAKGLCHIFLGWVEPPAWTELYSEVLFSASFNPSLFRSLKSFYLPQPPPTPIPTFSQTHLFFYIFISSTLIPCFPACDNKQSTHDFSANGLTCLESVAQVTESHNLIENVIKSRFPEGASWSQSWKTVLVCLEGKRRGSACKVLSIRPCFWKVYWIALQPWYIRDLTLKSRPGLDQAYLTVGVMAGFIMEGKGEWCIEDSSEILNT